MTLLIERDGPVTTVALNRPRARNAVDRETALALAAAFREFEADARARVAVLCGEGETFCAGYDLKEAARGGLAERYEPEGEGPMGPTRMLLSKPVIAAVEGYAVAGGLELALWCDLRIAGEGAVFGVFSRRWGIPLIDGGNVRLPRLVGEGRALEMSLTGRPVGAEEALAWGLANRVVPKGHAREAAQKLARKIAAFPQTCLRSDRRSILRQWDFDLDEALKFEGREGLAPLLEEAQGGAGRFAGGAGRGGSFEQG